ncbi:hypothetical protein EON68_03935, partial [archaeon]
MEFHGIARATLARTALVPLTPEVGACGDPILPGHVARSDSMTSVYSGSSSAPELTGALNRPLARYLRCVESNTCLACAAVQSCAALNEDSGAGESDPDAQRHIMAVRTAAQRDMLAPPASHVTLDPMWPYIVHAVFPLGVPPGVATGQPDAAAVAVAAAAAATASVDRKTVPLAFTLPSVHGLTPIDVDVRQLFSRLSPDNIITVLTALILERSVLVLSKDVSILPDVVSTLLALMYPFKWACPTIPVFGYEPPLLVALENPVPSLYGAHPVTALQEHIVEELYNPTSGNRMYAMHVRRPQPASDCRSGCLASPTASDPAALPHDERAGAADSSDMTRSISTGSNIRRSGTSSLRVSLEESLLGSGSTEEG